MKKLFLLFLIFIVFQVSAQENLTQTIRGIVMDKDTKITLPGANVMIQGSNPLIGTTTNIDGRFVIENVPTGRINLIISFVGYHDVILNEINLETGKELILNIEMSEMIFMSEEVVITAQKDKIQSINEMSTVSARSFTVEETSRYAGSRNDVARMASNYAGILGSDDSRNDIIIRGNSPSGLLWRLEGVDIPNPNHYGASESTGGPINIINNNQLANSDFFTGAFPAEYGNALSGVFDLKMRNGNDHNHEFLGQIGFNGFELGAEGPLSKKNNISYLINYRYSTLEVFEKFGVNYGTGTAIPKYQDGSFKINIPKSNMGSFSLFGVYGHSTISFENSKTDSLEQEDYYTGGWYDMKNGSDMAVVGLNHRYLINNTTYTRLTLAYTYHKFLTEIDTFGIHSTQTSPFFRNNHNQEKLFGSFLINKKLNSKHIVKGGIHFSKIYIDFIDSVYMDTLYNQPYDGFITTTEFDGNTYQLQPYLMWKYKISDELTLNTGLHYNYFAYNHTRALEPRLGLNWQFATTMSMSVGYGYHSQTAPITVYFNQYRLPNGNYIQTNKNIDLTHSQHFVLGYNWNLNEYSRIKMESYYQQITNVAVDGENENSFSMLNQGANFFVATPDTLVNEGSGYNYGLELTVERFLHQGLYVLLTTSLYESKYKGSDEIVRNTSFNGNYIVNGLIGKEWKLSRENSKKQLLLKADIKLTMAGGQRYTPVTAIQVGTNEYEAVYHDDKAYSQQYDDYFRSDFRIALRQNAKKITMEWAIDIQNVLDNRNIFNQTFNINTGETDYSYQTGRMIIPQFRILF